MEEEARGTVWAVSQPSPKNGFVQVKLAMKIPWSAGAEKKKQTFHPFKTMVCFSIWNMFGRKKLDFPGISNPPIYPRSPSQPLKGTSPKTMFLRREMIGKCNHPIIGVSIIFIVFDFQGL